MVELRLVQATDIEDDLWKYDVLEQFVSKRAKTDSSIDAILLTGDFIHAHLKKSPTPGEFKKTSYQINNNAGLVLETDLAKQCKGVLNEIIQKNIQGNQLDINSLSEEERRLFGEANMILQKLQRDVILSTVEKSYSAHALKLTELRKSTPIYGVLGNHDLTLAYGVLGDIVNFAEQRDKITHTGRSGVEFIFKGDINTHEVPGFYGKDGIGPLIEDFLIPYHSGNSLDTLSQKIRELSTKEKPSLEEQKEATMLEEVKGALRAYNVSERQRLGDVKEADIYLTHKTPDCDVAFPGQIKGDVTGDITRDYSAHATSVYGGHFHGGQIGKYSIRDLVEEIANDNGLETQIIDGVDVKVKYMSADEMKSLNAGTNHFLVTEYNAQKEVERIVVYEFVQDAA